MSEYIERESIRKSLMEVCSDENCPMFIAATIDQVIDYEPAADVAPVVHAYWKRVDKDDGGHDTVCSHCSTPIVTYLETPYCHNCGAKMDGGRYK